LWRSPGSSWRRDAENPDRFRDVLERPFAQVLQHDLGLVTDQIAHGP
jgi:hypothetical protein